MVCHSLPFMATNSSNLAAWARFGTSALFEMCLLLQHVLPLPNSSTHVATLHLGPMGSLWACIEGMDGHDLRFTGANVSNLAAWTRFGTSTLFEGCLLLQYVLVLPNSSTHVATLHLEPMRSLWAYIEGMDGLHLLFTGANVSVWLLEPGLALWPSSKDVCSSSMCWGFPILLPMLQHCIKDP